LSGVTTAPWYEDIATPALLRQARGSYGDAIRRSLAAAGCDDVPRNGAFVIGGMDRNQPEGQAMTQAEAVRFLGVTKQASSQLIDTLVLRGYLVREIDPQDRRRMIVRLTERGRAAAAAIFEAVESVDAVLAKRISPAELGGFRAGLAALAEIRECPDE
jgi:DNA-binding MarR family transcriptional regulator